ncbi:MAG: hypothetical protein KUG78_21835 [Kangiellaceae bacterium]|nr:hypothetical protein [Kangiellaceae bacterium]
MAASDDGFSSTLRTITFFHPITNLGLRIKHYFYLFVTLVLISPSTSLMANDKTSERISGVADFLIERANDNYLYIFQRKIQGNKALSCYFPETFDNLTIGGDSSLKRLLTSKDLWKESIQTDLEFLTIRSLAVEIESTLKVSEQSEKIASSALDFLNLFQLQVNGHRYDLNHVDPSLDSGLKERLNGFTDGLGQVVVDLNKFRRYQQLCPAPRVTMQQFKDEFDSLRRLNKNIQRWVEHLQTNAEDLRLKSQGNMSWQGVCEHLGLPPASCVDGPTTINAYVNHRLNRLVDPQLVEKINIIKTTVDTIRNNREKLINNAIRDAVCQKLKIPQSQCTDKQTTIAAITDIVNTGDGGDSRIDAELLAKIKAIKELAATLPSASEDITSQVFKALKKIKLQHEQQLKSIIERIAQDESNQQLIDEKEAIQREVGNFDRLTRHILFFASIADANSASEVKSILKNYTLPSVSFFEKRKEGNHFMITSYLGLAYNLNEEQQAVKTNNGLFAPIGLEYTRGVDWLNGNIRSASIMVSPVDFGHPINLKLNDIEKDFELDEIVAPSLTFALGLKDYPLTLGLGYQKGRSLTASSAITNGVPSDSNNTTHQTENRFILFFAFDMPLLNLHSD